MALKPPSKVSILIILCALLIFDFCYSQEAQPFMGEINADNINVRADSTVRSEIVCSLNRGESVVVVFGLYEWYKIRLPKKAPSFIRKDFVSSTDGKVGVVLKDRVNIRLGPGESQARLGKANKNEVVNILSAQGDWYGIEPIKNSFGWIHQRFVDKVSVLQPKENPQQRKISGY